MDKMHKIAEAVFGEELEVIKSFMNDDFTFSENTNKRVWYLGKSIQMMAEADYYIGFGWYLNIIENNRGCRIETEVAENYDICMCLINDDSMAEEILSDMVKEESKSSPIGFTLCGSPVGTTNPYIESDMTITYTKESDVSDKN